MARSKLVPVPVTVRSAPVTATAVAGEMLVSVGATLAIFTPLLSWKCGGECFM